MMIYVHNKTVTSWVIIVIFVIILLRCQWYICAIFHNQTICWFLCRKYDDV